MGGEVEFCHMSFEVFYKLMLWFLMGMTKNERKKELRCEVDVLHADKHESLIQVDTAIFNGFGETYPKYVGKFAISL